MSALTGTTKLIRLILRRDRILLPIWILLFALLPVVYASATDGLYPTAAARQEYYDSLQANPSLRSSLGPVFGHSLGALTAWRAGILILLIGLISALTVIRHTRAEEDAGRRELLGSTVLGRQAPLAAALAVTFGANLVLGALMTVLLIGYGLPVVGSVAFGLSFALAGWVFAAVGGLAAQLTQGAGAARGIAIAALGTAYVLRLAGDSADAGSSIAVLSWLSPIGWVQRVRPYAGEQWWVFGLLAALLVVLVAAAAMLQAHRDLGAGILPARLGRAAASPRLRSPVALAWRLHRGLLYGWVAGFAVIGAITGAASRSVDSLVEGSPQLRDYLERLGGTASLTDAYLATSVGTVALAAGAYAIQATLRLRAEETSLRAEPVLATAVSRWRWMTSHLIFAAVGPAAALAALALTAGWTAGSTADGLGHQLARLLTGAMVYLPAVWLLAAIAAAMFGLLPRAATPVAWAVLAGCVLVTFVGQLLQLSQRIMDLSPFTHVPRIPGAAFTAVPLSWMVAAAAALTVAGLAGFRRRDLVTG